ncbi:hypothetical protein ACFLUU_01460 [Chloroflexota bacterium]
MGNEAQQPSPIVKHWDEIGDDMKTFLQNPYSWLTDEIKKSESRRNDSHNKLHENTQFDTLMKILDLLNSMYFPVENHAH